MTRNAFIVFPWLIKCDAFLSSNQYIFNTFLNIKNICLSIKILVENEKKQLRTVAPRFIAYYNVHSFLWNAIWKIFPQLVSISLQPSKFDEEMWHRIKNAQYNTIWGFEILMIDTIWWYMIDLLCHAIFRLTKMCDIKSKKDEDDNNSDLKAWYCKH